MGQRHFFFAISTCLALALTRELFAEPAVQDYTVLLTARADKGRRAITLNWPADPRATDYTVWKRKVGETAWVARPPLAGTATHYTDRQITLGEAVDYRVVKNAQGDLVPYLGYGLIRAGIAVPPVHERGRLVLVVEDSVAAPLAVELAQLVEDLVGDGWSVIRADFDRGASPVAVKALIQSEHATASGELQAVFLFGNVPVPYSGDTFPDGHAEHRGAWPCDAWYGDLDGIYTDTLVNRTTGHRAENHNVPGDGKFDATVLPVGASGQAVELQVGRVDLANLPAFGKSEVELLRQYLRKNHAYRYGQLAIESRALIDDRFGPSNGEAFATDGWRNFGTLMGMLQTAAGNFADLENGSWLWAYGCGYGNYTGIPGMVTASDFAARDFQGAFYLLFGSYFGDWDSSNNLLRAALASRSGGLASVWAGRPHWNFAPMGLGETLGYCARLTQNENLLGRLNIGVNEGHVALMGDPTLRLHPVAPPTGLQVIRGSPDMLVLQWTAAAEAVSGYHVYAAPSVAGPFRQLTQNPVSSRRWNTRKPAAGRIYMVRAVRLVTTPGGSFFNLSQGAFIAVP